MTYETSVELIRQSFDSLQSSGLIVLEKPVDSATVLIGPGSQLDSVAFVSFLTDLEERLSRAAGKEFFLVLGDIAESSNTAASLTVEILARYILKAVAA